MDAVIRLCLIGAGGFCGAVLRYQVSGWVQDRSGSVTFPFGTLAVNMIGCLLIGLLTYLVETRSFFSVETRGFVLVGLLGAFTTFSTFGNETLTLLRDNRVLLALFNVGFQVIAGVALVWLGRVMASLVWR